MGIYIIAEAGVNHNGNRELAFKMIDAAAESGCDCIKFQTFQTEALVTASAHKAAYQKANTGREDTQYEMLKPLEFGKKDFEVLKRHCAARGIDFLSTPFDIPSVRLLEELNVSGYKLSSGDITDRLLLETVACTNKPLLLSTGMSTIEEVSEAVGWIEACGNQNITLMHCTSNYPASYDEVNMRAMLTLQNRFPYPTGYSDHTQGIHIAVMAAAMGARVIEKHFTLDKTMPGPDHKASLSVAELKEMVRAVRDVETAMGDGSKRPSRSELDTRRAATKSIVINTPLRKGTRLKREDMEIRRPGTGIAPKYMEQLEGKYLLRNVEQETVLQWEDVKQGDL